MDDLKKLINLDNLNRSLNFKNNSPFDHCICEDFFLENLQIKLLMNSQIMSKKDFGMNIIIKLK